MNETTAIEEFDAAKFAERVRSARDCQSLEAFAAATGVPTVTIRLMEAAKTRSVSVMMMTRMCAALGVRASDLFGVRDDAEVRG